jgi:crotonobetainyl-CoA:carnitine CoA-transferase CaiB-like acyl-CoA transferase
VTGALDDIRVLDFTHALNGPFCTMLLGHLGAEVIKIEPPDGDNFRRSWMPPNSPTDGYEFLAVNTNKKSVVLDLKTKRGVELARRLIAVSDVLVENYLPGTMERFGLDYESVQPLNPRLIYACSRGFGESGPYAPYGSNAGVNNAMTGWTHAAWQHSGKPGAKAMGIGDEAGGVGMAVGILGALHARERTGQGQKVEVAMQEALLGFMVSTFHEYFTGNKVSGPALAVADGYFAFRVPELSDKAWQQVCHLMERDDLVRDPRFETAQARARHSAELRALVAAWAGTKTRQELWEGLRDIAYFGAPVLSLEEVFDDPHVKARETFIGREHPTAGQIKLLAPWIHLSKTPTSIRTVAPLLGQDTDDVLASLDR